MKYLELCKIRIAFFTSLSALLGFFLKAGGPAGRAIALWIGVLVLACGAGALNQYQERETDRLMPRTGGRPLPSGRIKPARALIVSLALLVSGISVLLFVNVTAALLGLITILWYNGLYVRLKKRSAIAFIPGALVGVLPPLIGWIAAGGGFTERTILFVCFFFLLWQVLHSLLLALQYGSQYESAGLPALTVIFSSYQLSRITLSWVLAVAATGIVLAFLSISSSPALIALLALAVWPIWKGIGLLRARGAGGKDVIGTMNIYLAAQICLMLFGKVFS